MKALAQKDRPWTAMLGAAGAVGLAVALMDGGFVFNFVVEPYHRETLFHVAWSGGLVLGLVAACFDEVLGTRELLRQRPIAPLALSAARMRGCARVLVQWFVTAPLLALFFLALTDSNFELGHWRQLPYVWATMTPAVSACAIGLAAGSLPCGWLARLLCLGPLLLVPFSAVYWLERTFVGGEAPRGDVTSWPAFVVGHATIALLGVLLALATARSERDADRPLAPRYRHGLVAPVLAVAALLGCILVLEVQANVLSALTSTYPRPLVHDGRVVLAVRPKWREPWLVVDAEHRPTGVQLPVATPGLAFRSQRVQSETIRLEAPHQRMAESSGSGQAGWLLIDGDGVAWHQPSFGASFRRVDKSPTEPRFAPGTRADNHDVARAIVCIEPDAPHAWCLFAGDDGFTPMALPGGERPVRFARNNDERIVEAGSAATKLAENEDVLLGSEHVFVLRGARFEIVGRPKAQARARGDDAPTLRGRVTGDHLLGFTLEFDATAGVGAFRHDFAPRTGKELLTAACAVLMSALRPPLLQGAALVREPQSTDWTFGTFGERWPWVFDPLVTNGRRWWLVGLSVLLGAAAAWRARVRLRRLGAGAPAIRFWTVAALLLGPFGWLASVVVERPRAWARRELGVPAPAPRIVTSPVAEEVVA